MPSRFLGAVDRVLCGWDFLCAGSGGLSTLWPLSFSAASFAGSLGLPFCGRRYGAVGYLMRRPIGGLILFWGSFGNIDGAECCGLRLSTIWRNGFGRCCDPFAGVLLAVAAPFFYRGFFVGDGVGSALLLLMWACATAPAFGVHRVETTLTLQTYM